MKKCLAIIILACAALSAPAAIVLDQQHVDFAINFNSTLVGGATNPWLLTVRAEDDRDEYAGQRSEFADALRVSLVVAEAAKLEIPDDPQFAFLGAPGDPTWILPQTQEPGLLYAGFSTENKSAQSGWQGYGVGSQFLARGVGQGLFSGNRVQLSLASFSGPGNFHLYSLDDFGSAIVHFDTADGLSSLDFREFTPGNHLHFNFAFSAPGEYTIGLQASGILASGGELSLSDITVFHFHVVPEPSFACLLGAGGIALLSRRRRARPFRRERSPSPAGAEVTFIEAPFAAPHLS